MAISGRLSFDASIPSTPADFLELDVTISTCAFRATSFAFQRRNNKSPCFGGRNAREARHRRGQIAHDMPDRQRSMGEEDVWEMVFGQHAGSDGTSTVQVSKTVKGFGVERVVLGLTKTVGILQVNVGIDVGRSGGRRVEVMNGRFVRVEVRREVGRDGVGRRRQHGLLLLLLLLLMLLLFGGMVGPNSSEAVTASLSDPVAGLRNVNRGRLASIGRADGRVVLWSHIGGGGLICRTQGDVSHSDQEAARTRKIERDAVEAADS